MIIFIFIQSVNRWETLPTLFQDKINFIKDTSFRTAGVCTSNNRNVELIQEVKTIINIARHKFKLV
jgi:hypothetical protein